MAFIFPFGGSASANEPTSLNNKYLKSSELIDGETFYTYKYKGVEISGNSVLTEEQTEGILSSIKKKEKEPKDVDGGISTYYVPVPEFPGYIVDGPYKRHYDNSDVRFTAEAVTAWVGTKIPAWISKNAFLNFAFNRLTGWANNIEDTYAVTYITKAYSDYHGLYEYYGTLVHYTDSSYSTPKEVQYYVVDREPY
jgi:hypothetical protein